MTGDKAHKGFRGRSSLHHGVHSASAALCQVSRLCSAGAAALPKQQHCTSDFRWEEQLLIKNNNLEVSELYFPWLPHAQNLDSTDKSCAFGFNILSQSRLESAAWVFRWREGSLSMPDLVLLIPPCLEQLFVTLRGNGAWLCCQQIVLRRILTGYSHFDPRGSSKTDITENQFVGVVV